MNKKVKNILICISTILGIAFTVLSIIAKRQRDNDKYLNDPSEQNPFYKKRVVFVDDENDPINADGKRGHLEAVGGTVAAPTFYEKYIKRFFDIVLSFFGMVFLAPIYAVTAIAIKKEDPGPALFKQKRIAQQNGYFDVLKFRSMKLDTPKNLPTHQLGDPDKYLLRIGRTIRHYSIDELPQLYCTFKGDMSLIGPRPALWNQDFLVAERDKYGANEVKPGITGLAQISGRDELEIEEKAQLDGEYARRLRGSNSVISGLAIDAEILIKTVFSVLRSDGVVEGGTGAMKKGSDS